MSVRIEQMSKHYQIFFKWHLMHNDVSHTVMSSICVTLPCLNAVIVGELCVSENDRTLKQSGCSASCAQKLLPHHHSCPIHQALGGAVFIGHMPKVRAEEARMSQTDKKWINRGKFACVFCWTEVLLHLVVNEQEKKIIFSNNIKNVWSVSSLRHP